MLEVDSLINFDLAAPAILKIKPILRNC